MLYLLSLSPLWAQYSITGKVIGVDNEPLAFANVLTLSVKDSSLVTGKIADVDGAFELEIPMAGQYILSVSLLGYESFFSLPFALMDGRNSNDFGTIALNEGGITLEAVEVKAEKPLIINKIDRTVLNIENRVNTAGASVIEVLEGSPGVLVNRQSSSLKMLGKEGVNVMVNGKPQYMPPEALFNFLSGLSADNVKSIELITTPPANFDAQGNAGFINIVLKSNPEEGINGTYSLSGGYGRGEVVNGNVTLNYRKGKVSGFGSYAYVRNGQEQFSDLNRLLGAGTSEVLTLGEFNRFPLQNNHNARLGLDIDLSDRTAVGIVVSGYSNQWDMDATNEILFLSAQPDTVINSEVDEENDWKHLRTNLHLTHSFTGGSALSLNADYLVYDNQNPITYAFAYNDENQTPLFTRNIFSDKDTPFSIWVGAADYSLPINEQWQIELGGKYTSSTFENDVLAAEEGIPLPGFTSNSDLTEKVAAGYAQANVQVSPQLTLKAGLRYEYTDSDLFSTNGGQVVDREFGSWFPSVFLSNQFSETLGGNLSFTRRINRPAFSDMAPFIIFLDPNTSFGGDASLQPAISNTIQTAWNVGDVNLTIQYTWEDSTLVGYQNRFSPETNTQLVVPANLKDQQLFSTTISTPLKLLEGWNMTLFATYLYQSSTTVEPLGEFTFNQHNFQINGNQTITLPADLSFTVSGFFESRSLSGNLRFDPYGVLNVGLQKKLKVGRITFNVTDLLNSLELTGTTDLSEENAFMVRTFDFSQRTFKVTYTASFGNQKLRKKSQQRALEELQRVN